MAAGEREKGGLDGWLDGWMGWKASDTKTIMGSSLDTLFVGLCDDLCVRLDVRLDCMGLWQGVVFALCVFVWR